MPKTKKTRKGGSRPYVRAKLKFNGKTYYFMDMHPNKGAFNHEIKFYKKHGIKYRVVKRRSKLGVRYILYRRID